MNPYLMGRETVCFVNKYPTSTVLCKRTVRKSGKIFNDTCHALVRGYILFFCHWVHGHEYWLVRIGKE